VTCAARGSNPQGLDASVRHIEPVHDLVHVSVIRYFADGLQRFLWRAVDQDGDVLDILVQKRRNKTAAKRFFRTLLKGLKYAPRCTASNNLTVPSDTRRGAGALRFARKVARIGKKSGTRPGKVR
jgi:hypothetical protein